MTELEQVSATCHPDLPSILGSRLAAISMSAP